MSKVLPQRLSSLHRRHLSLGAHMTSQDGWQRPARYTSAQEEAAAVQQAVGLCDISPVGKLLVQGNDIGKVPEASPLKEDPTPGQVTRYNASGLACPLSSDQLLLITPPSALGDVRASLDASQETLIHIVDMTSALTALCLAGPRSQDVLGKLTDLDLFSPSHTDMTCTQTSLSGVQAILVRADFPGMPAYRLFVSRDLGEFAWDVLTEAGSHEGMLPFGTEALRLLRGEG